MTNELIHNRLMDVEAALRGILAFATVDGMAAWMAEHPDASPYVENEVAYVTAQRVLDGARYEVAHADAQAEQQATIEEPHVAVDGNELLNQPIEMHSMADEPRTVADRMSEDAPPTTYTRANGMVETFAPSPYGPLPERVQAEA